MRLAVHIHSTFFWLVVTFITPPAHVMRIQPSTTGNRTIRITRVSTMLTGAVPASLAVFWITARHRLKDIGLLVCAQLKGRCGATKSEASGDPNDLLHLLSPLTLHRRLRQKTRLLADSGRARNRLFAHHRFV